jgi:hypothetical protein
MCFSSFVDSKIRMYIRYIIRNAITRLAIRISTYSGRSKNNVPSKVESPMIVKPTTIDSKNEKMK